MLSHPLSDPTRTVSDEELVRDVLDGKIDAETEFVRRFERPIFSLILRMVRDRGLAEDLAQETFLKAFRNLRSYDARYKLASWLFKIAHNTTLDHLRRKRVATVSLTAPPGADDAGGEIDVPAPEHQGPEHRARQAQTVAGLEPALTRLDPRYREILLLRFREGLAYREIAEATGLEMGTVKVRLHRARRHLADELEALGLRAAEKGAGS